MRFSSAIAGFIICAALASTGVAQQSHTTVRHRRVETTETSPTAEKISQAEAEIVKNNFAQAESLLQAALEQNPKDFQAWYDLGFVHDSVNKPAEAISDYKKSIALNPRIFESNLNLGLLLAQQGNNAEAETYLKSATQLKPTIQPEAALSRAWNALGKVIEDRNPQEALNAFRQAERLQPQIAAPHLSAAELLERQGQSQQARVEYKQAAALAHLPDERRTALIGLVNTALATNSSAEAEGSLREYLKQNPSDSTGHVLMGRLLASQDKKQEAVAELNQAAKLNSSDPKILQEKAQLLVDLKRYDEASASYKEIIQQNPKEAGAHHQYGVMLMQQHRFQDALPELIAALKIDPGLGAAYGDLAVAASESKQYALAIQALDARAKMMPESAATHFLRATAYDNLKQFPKATAEYKEFLASAEGRYPEKEWQARHRLIAIEKLK